MKKKKRFILVGIDVAMIVSSILLGVFVHISFYVFALLGTCLLYVDLHEIIVNNMGAKKINKK
jgi:hypothetical protein